MLKYIWESPEKNHAENTSLSGALRKLQEEWIADTSVKESMVRLGYWQSHALWSHQVWDQKTNLEVNLQKKNVAYSQSDGF